MQTLSADHLVNKKLGNYSIESLLGQSRLHAVYLARNLQSQRSHALTLYLLPERFPADARDRFLLRFLKEAHAVASLHHAHILPVLDYGEFSGYPYLVTPYMTNGSLADILKQHGRYAPADIQQVLVQLSSGLEYAHEQGFVHGTLKPANIILSTQGSFQLAGFGLMHMLQLCGIEQTEQPYAHLLSIAGSFLIAPEYVAPEVVEGQAIDIRSDIYAFGCILFELLSGRPPFIGNKPLEIARQHVQQSIPSLHILCPDLPPALVAVVNQALAREPERRFQHISELRTAFDYALGAVSTSERTARPTRTTTILRQDASTSMRKVAPASPATNKTMPLQETPAGGHNWQLMPPIVTGKMAAIPGSNNPVRSATRPIPTGTTRPTGKIDAPQKRTATSTGRLPGYEAAKPTLVPQVAAPPTLLPKPAAPTLPPTPAAAPTMPPLSADPYIEDAVPSTPAAVHSYAEVVRVKPARPDRPVAAPLPAPPPAPAAFNTVSYVNHDSAELAKAYGWWAEPDVSPSAAMPPVRLKPARPQVAPEPLQLSNSDWGDGMQVPPPARTRRPQQYTSSSSNNNSSSNRPNLPRRRVIAMLAGGSIAVAGLGFAAIEFGHMLGAASHPQAAVTPAAPAAQPPAQTTNKTTAAKTTPQKPATQPQTATTGKTAKPNATTGTIIGSVSQANNTAVKFTNPADNQASLLIHLSGSTFVASETACTHQGVTVNYDPATKKLVCPRHGAIFDPANAGKVLQGPATTAIPQVKVQVNADGTVSTL